MRFTQQVRDAIEASAGWRTGVVQAVSTAEGLDVLIGGGLVTGLQSLAAYAAPGVGDVVAVIGRPGAYLVLGKVGQSGVNLGPNLLPNPGFEFGITSGNLNPSGWSDFFSNPTGGVSWVNDEALAHSSGAAALFETGSLTAAQFRRLFNEDAIVVDTGVTYRLAAWFRSDVADPNTEFRLTVVTGATQNEAQLFSTGTTVDIASQPASTTGWVELSGVRTIPAGHNYLRFFPSVFVSSGRISTAVYVDDVSLRQQI